jgi:uncharacterized protein YdhG (YjbR/CyaY superfamily)
MKSDKAATIDEYIESFPKDIQKILKEVRATVRKAAPRAEETIKYGMPTFTYKGNLVYFAAFKKHLGFFPAPTNDPSFEKALSLYKTGKGSIQFPYDQPMPLSLITRITRWRIQQNSKKEAAKKSAR